MQLKRIGKTVNLGNGKSYAEVGVVVKNGATHPPVVELTVRNDGYYTLTVREYGQSMGEDVYTGKIEATPAN